MSRPIPNDGWFDAEAPTRKGLVQELQRIAQRTRARPWRVLLLAALLTSAIGYRVAHKKPIVESEEVLALTEGALSEKSETASVAVEQLRQYVATVLLPDDKLLAFIQKKNLFPIRKTMGDQYAIDELRDQIEITIWKNTFVYYDEDIAHPEHSARIGITVLDTDPDRGSMIAHALAGIVIETAGEHRRQVAAQLAKEVAALREGLTRRLTELSAERARRVGELLDAQRDHHDGAAAGLTVVIAELEHQQKKLELQLSTVVNSRDAMADQIATAGLDMSVQIVEEHNPERNEHSAFVLVMILVVVGLGALAGSALVFGAFDSRLHDLDDLVRLGVPVLGHVPGFPGDHVGSLETRGALRRRVPSFLRWRSQR